MITAITRAAYRLDSWLQQRFGRPYRALLSIGLIIEIGRRLSEMPEHLKQTQTLIGGGLIIAMNIALLINQLGEMSHRLAARRQGAGGQAGA